MTTQQKAREKPHYVHSGHFSTAVADYVTEVKEAENNGDPKPPVTKYIAESFLKICEGLSHKHNFVKYTFREEMVMDAVENCLRAIRNYDITKKTRTKKPNAFGYFTQIAIFAFLRRIEKEKKERDGKLEYMAKMGIENFIYGDDENCQNMINDNQHFVDTLRNRIDKVKSSDNDYKKFKKEKKIRRQRTVKVDSDLSEFIG